VPKNKDIFNVIHFERARPRGYVRRSFRNPIKSVREYLQTRKDGKVFYKDGKIVQEFQDSEGKVLGPKIKLKGEFKNERINLEDYFEGGKNKTFFGKMPKEIKEVVDRDRQMQALKLVGPTVYTGAVASGGLALYNKKRKRKKGMKKTASSEYSDQYMLSKVLERTALQAMELKTKIEQGTNLASWAEYKVYKAGDAISAAHSSTYRINDCISGSMPMRMVIK